MVSFKNKNGSHVVRATDHGGLDQGEDKRDREMWTNSKCVLEQNYNVQQSIHNNNKNNNKKQRIDDSQISGLRIYADYGATY